MKKTILTVFMLMCLVLTACSGASIEKAAFQAAVESAEAMNASIDEAISPAQELLDSSELALDESTRTDLQIAVSSLRERKKVIPEIPSKVDEILAETEKLTADTDFSEEQKNLQAAQKAFEDSVKQLAQITNPTGDFVVGRLSEIETVGDIQGVTEDNDPNGNLNKQGGYTSSTYFSSTHIEQSDVYGDTTIDKGTDGGGCIEVYATVEEAEARNTYLSAFDGMGALSSGSHVVFGTVVIRTSDRLTATQQNELTEQIKAKLIELR